MKGSKRDIYPRIRSLLYAFAEGQDTARHSGSTFASAASNSTWNGIFLPNSEHSFSVLAEKAGESRDAGEYARCFDVPATADGVLTVFDRRPSDIEQSNFLGWSRKKLAALRIACEKNHGVALPPFLKFLIEKDDRGASSAREYMEEFAGALNLQTDDRALQHAARNCPRLRG